MARGSVVKGLMPVTAQGFQIIAILYMGFTGGPTAAT